MKIKFFLALMAVSTCALLAQPAAQADPPSARFKYPVNYWKMEGATGPGAQPAYTPPPRTVNSGSVPKGSSILGINPKMLAKHAPPVAVISSQPVNNASGVPLFNNMFGSPKTGNALPLTAAPAKITPIAQAPYKVAKHTSNSGVNGHLRTKPAPRYIARAGGPARINSYGNQGYTAGSTMPINSFGAGGGGQRSSSTVNGKVLPTEQK